MWIYRNRWVCCKVKRYSCQALRQALFCYIRSWLNSRWLILAIPYSFFLFQPLTLETLPSVIYAAVLFLLRRRLFFFLLAVGVAVSCVAAIPFCLCLWPTRRGMRSGSTAISSKYEAFRAFQQFGSASEEPDLWPHRRAYLRQSVPELGLRLQLRRGELPLYRQALSSQGVRTSGCDGWKGAGTLHLHRGWSAEQANRKTAKRGKGAVLVPAGSLQLF